MDSGRDKKRIDVEVDRLSNLPEDLIHKILSFISIKQAIETSALSSRWRFLWTSMPYLNFSTVDFPSLPKFSKFINHVLSRRNTLTEVFSVNLCFCGKVSHAFVKRILNYAIDHNVQQLNVECLLENDIKFPVALFNSPSLKYLSLKKNNCWKSSTIYSMKLISTWELPALTTLHLCGIQLSDDNTDKCSGLFSKCVNLKYLNLQQCLFMGSNGFDICHSRLSELTLNHLFGNVSIVNVVAPQLKNISIRCSLKKILISAPDLAFLRLDVSDYDFTADGFRSLEKVDICLRYPRDYIKISDLLQHFRSVKFLTLNLEMLELLSSSVEVISHQPSPFADLKSLKIYPLRVYNYELPKENLMLATEVTKYLLDSSPSATVTMILREDILIQRLMAELRWLLQQEKYSIGTNMAHMELKSAPTESHSAKIDEPAKSHSETKTQLHNEEKMANIMSSWNNLSEQVTVRKEKACDIIWKFRDIENLLAKLPASKRAVIQPCFTRLHAEADNIMNKIKDCMKVQCEEYQSRLTVCFHELASALEPSS